MKNMKLIALFFGAFLFVNGLNAQTTNASAPTDAVTGYTYDFDLAKKLIIDYQLTPNQENSIAKQIVESNGFPKLSGKTALNSNYHEKLGSWMEKNHSIVIKSLKSRKEIVHTFDNK